MYSGRRATGTDGRRHRQTDDSDGDSGRHEREVPLGIGEVERERQAPEGGDRESAGCDAPEGARRVAGGEHRNNRQRGERGADR